MEKNFHFDPTPSEDPFHKARQQHQAVECDFAGEKIPMLLSHAAVREAARDWKRFSSDAPFRVPIPSEEKVRTTRQLPIETDPPVHTEYRKIIEPFFMRPRETWMQERLASLMAQLLDAAIRNSPVDAVGAFAIPLQSRSLAILLGVPESEAEEWISWGLNALKDEGLSESKGARLDSYIRRKIAEAARDPGDDLFGTLQRATFQGRKLDVEEMVGFVNLVFAGGRDTVIHSITGILNWFAEHPDGLEALRQNPAVHQTAIEEFFRYLSPIPHLGRVSKNGDCVHGLTVPPGGRISLCWASANRDESVFENPDQVVLDRKPNPHVSFGSGPHSCIGALHARAIVRQLITQLCEKVRRIEVLERHHCIEDLGGFRRKAGFEKLVVKLHTL